MRWSSIFSVAVASAILSIIGTGIGASIYDPSTKSMLFPFSIMDVFSWSLIGLFALWPVPCLMLAFSGWVELLTLSHTDNARQSRLLTLCIMLLCLLGSFAIGLGVTLLSGKLPAPPV